MTAKAEYTYDQYKTSGWSDQQLIDNGLMEPAGPAAPPAAPSAPAAPAAPSAPAADPAAAAGTATPPWMQPKA
jgi:hypothetical protein